MAIWDGKLKIKGNKIKSFTAVNFWNPDSQPRQTSANELAWKSITTGGLTGVIIQLEKPYSGRMEISTTQKNCSCKIGSIGMANKTYKAGGLRKLIQIYRLPDASACLERINYSMPLIKLRKGDNPVYVKMVQQDGHIAWSSPIYIVK